LRVLHINPGNLFGGIETLLVTLARQRALCPGMEPCFALCFEGRLSQELRAAGVPVGELGAVRVSRPWTLWRARRRLRESLAREPVDAVVCHGCWAHALFGPVARAAGVPLVFMAHGLQAELHWLDRWAALTRPDLVLANSRATRDSVARNLFPSSHSEVVYLPVAPPAQQFGADDRAQVRAALRTAPGDTVIVLTSRLEEGKGHTLLLRALARLSHLPDWVCWVAGGPQRPQEAQYLAQLEAQTRQLGLTDRVRFLGQRSDVPRLLAAADIHCQPNLGPESFGIAFVEGLYAGLPVVTTAMGGALEIVEDDCGVLVPPNDPQRLGDALALLIQDPDYRRRLGAAAPARARAICDPATRMRQLAGVLGSLGTNRNGSAPC
jgi:glycosyltransferase involved in cell wall biosynthesis